MKLTGKVALVTGGSSGIGKAIVLVLASEGCNVAFTYNSKQTESDELVKTVTDLGITALAIKVDMRSEDEVKSIFTAFTEVFQELDVLVNNAGINRPRDLFSTVD